MRSVFSWPVPDPTVRSRPVEMKNRDCYYSGIIEFPVPGHAENAVLLYNRMESL